MLLSGCLLRSGPRYKTLLQATGQFLKLRHHHSHLRYLRTPAHPIRATASASFHLLATTPHLGSTSEKDAFPKSLRRFNTSITSIFNTSSTTVEGTIDFPVGAQTFERTLKRKQGVFWVDKTEYIDKLEKLNAEAVVSLRPRRFGKSLFLDTLDRYYNVLYQDQYKDIFGHLAIGKLNPSGPSQRYYVIRVDLSGLGTSTPQAFSDAFRDKINRSVSEFKRSVSHSNLPQNKKVEFQVNPGNALDSIADVCGAIRSTGLQVGVHYFSLHLATFSFCLLFSRSSLWTSMTRASTEL